MPLPRLALVEAGAVHGKMARVERGGELPQCVFLAGAFRTLEQDDRAAPVGDLRQLQLTQMLA